MYICARVHYGLSRIPSTEWSSAQLNARCQEAVKNLTHYKDPEAIAFRLVNYRRGRMALLEEVPLKVAFVIQYSGWLQKASVLYAGAA